MARAECCRQQARWCWGRTDTAPIATGAGHLEPGQGDPVRPFRITLSCPPRIVLARPFWPTVGRSAVSLRKPGPAGSARPEERLGPPAAAVEAPPGARVAVLRRATPCRQPHLQYDVACCGLRDTGDRHRAGDSAGLAWPPPTLVPPIAARRCPYLNRALKYTSSSPVRPSVSRSGTAIRKRCGPSMPGCIPMGSDSTRGTSAPGAMVVAPTTGCVGQQPSRTSMDGLPTLMGPGPVLRSSQ